MLKFTIEVADVHELAERLEELISALGGVPRAIGDGASLPSGTQVAATEKAGMSVDGGSTKVPVPHSDVGQPAPKKRGRPRKVAPEDVDPEPGVQAPTKAQVDESELPVVDVEKPVEVKIAPKTPPAKPEVPAGEKRETLTIDSVKAAFTRVANEVGVEAANGLLDKLSDERVAKGGQPYERIRNIEPEDWARAVELCTGALKLAG